GGASRRRGWSCRGRHGRRSRCSGGRLASWSPAIGARARQVAGSRSWARDCIGYDRRMTVAAVLLAASPESALADADGVPAIRRIVDAAWSGGATPVVVVSFDPTGAVGAALAGASVTLAEPAPQEQGPAAQIARGADVARAEVVETDGVLLWPARLTWVGPETGTSPNGARRQPTPATTRRSRARRLRRTRRPAPRSRPARARPRLG